MLDTIYAKDRPVPLGARYDIQEGELVTLELVAARPMCIQSLVVSTSKELVYELEALIVAGRAFRTSRRSDKAIVDTFGVNDPDNRETIPVGASIAATFRVVGGTGNLDVVAIADLGPLPT